MLGLGIFTITVGKESTAQQANVQILNARSFATAPNAKTGAAFMTLKNTGSEDDILLSVSSEVAEKTEIHENMVDPDDGKMMMRRVKEIKIAGKSEVELEPAGYHIMLINLKAPLEKGESFPVTLTFEKSGERMVNTAIVAPGMAQIMDPSTDAHNHDEHSHQH
jgi:copper(I)-binding protein